MLIEKDKLVSKEFELTKIINRFLTNTKKLVKPPHFSDDMSGMSNNYQKHTSILKIACIISSQHNIEKYASE